MPSTLGEASAAAITEMTELAFGDRIGRVRDPFGNLWWIMEHVVDLTSDAMAARWALPEFIRAMEYVQRADIMPKRAVDAPRR